MLHDFLTANRSEIIARARRKVASRAAPLATEEEMEQGIPLFLTQLVEALTRPGSADSGSIIGVSAARHGGALLRRGFTIAQVVHDYGDVCQSVTELAEELSALITTDEFRTLNLCLDDAIAQAVTEYSRLRQHAASLDEGAKMSRLAVEMRTKVGAAMLAFSMLKEGRVGVRGSTGLLVERSLRGLRDLIDGSLAELRIIAGGQERERISVAELIEEIELDASLDAKALGLTFAVAPVLRDLVVDADRPIVAAALIALLRNAFKFSKPGSRVSLSTTAREGRVLLEVEDECGGLTTPDSETLFAAAAAASPPRVGLELSLSLARRGIEGSGGTLGVRDLPGAGCVFLIDLPLVAPPSGGAPPPPSPARPG